MNDLFLFVRSKGDCLMSDNLEAWNVQEADFPSAGTLFDQLKFLLRYGVLAPSGPNTQPWKLSIKAMKCL
jgi:hypothetical protein